MLLTRAQFSFALASTLYVMRNSKLPGAGVYRPGARHKREKQAKKQTRVRRNSRHSRRAIESQSSYIRLREDMK